MSEDKVREPREPHEPHESHDWKNTRSGRRCTSCHCYLQGDMAHLACPCPTVSDTVPRIAELVAAAEEAAEYIHGDAMIGQPGAWGAARLEERLRAAIAAMKGGVA